jgi:CheY-like chemotaxis protein
LNVPSDDLKFLYRTLLFDENLSYFQVATLLLSKIGALCDVARNGQEAIDLLLTGSKYDFILMDLNMPVLDGVEATKRIRQLEGDRMLPGKNVIFALTAAALTEVREMCLKIGMDGFLPKPLNLKELKRRISKLRK